MAARLSQVSVLVIIALGGGCGEDPAPAAGGRDGAVDLAPLPDAGIDAPADGTVDLGVDAGADPGEAGGDLANVDGAMCVGPIPGCTGAHDGVCDPVCQSRCGCQQRCAITAGVATCAASPSSPVPVGERCAPRADDCAAGAICLEDLAAACGDRCFRLCRRDADCPGGGACTIDVQFGASSTAYKVCSPPAEACDPTGAAPCTRAGAAAFGCYVLSANHPDTAVCDCAGRLKLGDACNFEHECQPGLECVRAAGASSCRRTCKLADPVVCPAGQACKPLGLSGKLSSLYGFCE